MAPRIRPSFHALHRTHVPQRCHKTNKVNLASDVSAQQQSTAGIKDHPAASSKTNNAARNALMPAFTKRRIALLLGRAPVYIHPIRSQTYCTAKSPARRSRRTTPSPGTFPFCSFNCTS
jgi:hypothetical protein